MTALRPFFKYFGGKFRAASTYPAPMHDIVIEPFAGAAGYATRYHDREVILIERDPVIASVWQYIIDTPSDEIRALPLFGPLDTVWDFDLDGGARDLIGLWLNSGVNAPRRRPHKRMRDWLASGARGASYWGVAVRERIAEQSEKIRHWTVINADYSDAPDIEATWFIDPPYQAAGKHYRFGSSKLDFPRLGEWCKSRAGQVIVCENSGAEWLPFQTHRTIQAMPGTKRTGVSHEVVWYG